MKTAGMKITKPVNIIQQVEVGNELSQKNLQRLRNLKKSMFRSTLTNDEMTNNTFDEHMSCQTFLQCLPNSDNLDLSDDHMCPYKKRYLLDQLKNAINQSQNLNISLITRALQKYQDSFEKKFENAMMTDEENLSVRGLEQIKNIVDKMQDRQMRIQRYKNKKRNWDRQISYRGRSKVAETRLRIKGRFISKEDQKSINKLLNYSGKQEDFFDNKKNLDIEKFDQRTHLFDYAKDPKCIPKKQILTEIRDEYKFQAQQNQILKQIKKRGQLFTILNKQQKQ